MTSMAQAQQSAPVGASSQPHVKCRICGHDDDGLDPTAFGTVRGNTHRFLGQEFRLWKCPQCLSIHSLDPVDFGDIYADYPLNRRRLDVFARGTLGNLLRRLVRAGLKKTDSVLDYGCGNGLFVQYLGERGYARAAGYDPYVGRFASLDLESRFDCVVANDVIEHVEDPRALVAQCAKLCRPEGLIYFGTADSEPVDMRDLEPHIMRLHQPFHRIILTQSELIRLALEPGLGLLRSYRRSYMDTLMPFSNYRFLDEFNAALGNDMDRALDPAAGRIVGRKPSLLLYAFFGYFMPSAYEPAVVLRKPLNPREQHSRPAT
jgi:SAM-dependent methyltransferase